MDSKYVQKNANIEVFMHKQKKRELFSFSLPDLALNYYPSFFLSPESWLSYTCSSLFPFQKKNNKKIKRWDIQLILKQ